MSELQPLLPIFEEKQLNWSHMTYYDKLRILLSSDLDFHDQDSGYSSHGIHAFPAKFPPQLPKMFIEVLTSFGEIVLDPMMGSGTTVLETYLSGRRSIAFDIDPLSVLLTKVKVTPLDLDKIKKIGHKIILQAKFKTQKQRDELNLSLKNRFGSKTRHFINYWFAQETQIDLLALIQEIETIKDHKVRAFFELIFSAIIITKSGGVSLAFDLAHTRPHRAKIVFDQKNKPILGHDLVDDPSPREEFLTKQLKSPIIEFEKRFLINIRSFEKDFDNSNKPWISFGNAQNLPLDDSTVDLIVTSPPYAANAIDYMRAHKFSLAWLGYPIDALGNKRKEYIGGESITNIEYLQLPNYTANVVGRISQKDEKKGRVLHRYYSEMTRGLNEMFRVLKPGKAAVVVVGNSTMRGIDTETQNCLADIGQSIGFEIPKIGVRHLDRNRRMMPSGSKRDTDSQIQQRMHEEYVIGFYKPK